MAKSKYCPICDQPMKGRFCWRCKEFVKPYEIEMNDPMEEDSGSSKASGKSSPGVSQPNSRKTMEQAKRSFESHGAVRSTGASGSGYQSRGWSPENLDGDTKKRRIKKVALLFGSIWLLSVLVGFAVRIIFFNISDSRMEDREIEVDIPESMYEIEDFLAEDDMAFPFTAEQEEGYLSDEEYQQLLAENGFDEDGYKDADYDAILAAGEPCNGWVHFDTTARTASRHIRSALEEEGIAASNYDTGTDMDNYYYMNQYGEIESYFHTYLYVVLEVDESGENYSGFMYMISDSVTNELMAVCIKEDNLDVFEIVSRVVMTELDPECAYEAENNFSYDISAALQTQDGYDYLEYGSLWYDFSYYDEIPADDYQYTGWVYLADTEE